jgi:hypothetical protein
MMPEYSGLNCSAIIIVAAMDAKPVTKNMVAGDLGTFRLPAYC